MLRRRLTLFALTAGLAQAAGMWPPQLGPYKLKSATPAEAQGHAAEYGMEAAETADYGAFQVSGSRFKDTTAAYAAALEQTGTQVGNYTVQCSGHCPANLAELARKALPAVSGAPFPLLPTYLPPKGRSERYILGPLSLQDFVPAIPATAAAFQFGTEAVTAQYGSSRDPVTLAIFSYPTPQIARQQLPEFQKVTGILVKRDGPLVVAVTPSSAAAAQSLLARVAYQASVSWDQRPPVVVKAQSVGRMMLAIFELAGIVLAFCILSGLAYAAFRMLSRKFGSSDAAEAMVWLRLQDK
jgi:hypothetical protein